MNAARGRLGSLSLPIIIAPLILFSAHIFGGKALFWGTPALQFVPWWSWAWETILNGHLPLWNPLLGMGAPLIANYQSALFYPPYWLYFVLYAFGGIGWMAWAQSLIVVGHLILAGMGMAALTRRLGMSRLSQTIGGLAFSLSGYLVARAWFASINAAVAWLPWVMLFAYDLAKDRNLRACIKLGLVFGMQLLAGHAQTSWYTLVLAGVWSAFWGWRFFEERNSQERLKRTAQSIARLGIALLLGIGIAAVQLLPTAVYLMQSQRSGAVDIDFALNYSFWPWRLIGLLAPGIFGSPVTGDYWGYGNFWEDAVYVGVLPFLLAVGVLFSKFWKKDLENGRETLETGNAQRSPLEVFLFGIVIISFLLSFGKNTPIYPWLYDHIPTFDMFQAPTRISIWAVFGLTLLAAIGVDQWQKPEGRALYWTRLGTAGSFAVSLGASLAYLGLGEVSSTFIRATAFAGLWGLGAGMLTLTKPANESNSRGTLLWTWVVVVWVAADLLVAGWGLNPGIDLEFYTQPAVVKDVGEGRVYLSNEHEDTFKYERFLRFDTFDPGEDWNDIHTAILPNINVLAGIPSANNFDPFVPERYAKWMHSIKLVDDATKERLLDLMGVTLLEVLDDSRGSGVHFEPREAARRLRWVPCAVSAEDEHDAWEQTFFGSLDFGNYVIIEGAQTTPGADCASHQGQVHFEEDGPNKLIVTIDSDVAGWVVLSDVWYPGWRAYMDGEAIQIQRADYLFRAIKSHPGIHQLSIEYQPLEFYVGVLISMVTLCILLFLQRNSN